jgi:mannose-6-phosphate isomerase
VYPLKFRPVFQKRIWGGQRLRAVLGKSVGADLARANVGESWELADLPAGTVKGDSVGATADGSLASEVMNGALAGRDLQQVLRAHGAEVMGDAALNHGHFPLLIKFLDAQTDLSVQVHPDEKYCAGHGDAHLKSEAWYILHAEPGAKIYKGVRPGVTRETFAAALRSGEVEPLLNAVKVRAGDCHYLQSGTVHALGAGILAAEVQTPSDTTFRVFDWNRLGADGKPRALHIEQALACIRFEDEPQRAMDGDAGRLVSCDYFSIRRDSLAGSAERELKGGEPTVWIVLEGQGVLLCEDAGPTAFTRGDTMLLPAQMTRPRVRTVADSVWLEVRLPVNDKSKSAVRAS